MHLFNWAWREKDFLFSPLHYNGSKTNYMQRGGSGLCFSVLSQHIISLARTKPVHLKYWLKHCQYNLGPLSCRYLLICALLLASQDEVLGVTGPVCAVEVLVALSLGEWSWGELCKTPSATLFFLLPAFIICYYSLFSLRPRYKLTNT